MTYKNVELTKKEDIAWITINRPQALNALNSQTLSELISIVTDLEKDKKIKVAVLKGAGDKAFVAGADIKEMQNMNVLQARDFAEKGHSLISTIRSSRIPYIAMIQGFALGGGCELMMACDVSIGGKSAKFGQPEINLGISPGFGGTQNLPRLVGRSKAKELLLTGNIISAEEAYRIGLLCQLVDDENLVETTEKIAKKIAGKSTVQTHFIKALVNKGVDIDISSASDMEIAYFSSGFATNDQKEGMAAFLEKRKPEFKGH